MANKSCDIFVVVFHWESSFLEGLSNIVILWLCSWARRSTQSQDDLSYASQCWNERIRLRDFRIVSPVRQPIVLFNFRSMSGGSKFNQNLGDELDAAWWIKPWPNGLASRRKSTINLCRLALGGQRVKSLRRMNLSSTKVIASQRKWVAKRNASRTQVERKSKSKTRRDLRASRLVRGSHCWWSAMPIGLKQLEIRRIADLHSNNLVVKVDPP